MSEEAVGRRRLFSWAAWTSVVGFLWPHAVWADSKGSGSGGPGLGEKVAGTYFLTVQHDGFPLALALVTLTRDGGFISNDTSDHGALGLTHDGPVHGTWKKTGARRIKARTLYFAFDDAGVPIWIARTNGEFQFDHHFATGAGTLTIERFTLDQDPLDPTAISVDPDSPLNATFTARRVTAD